MIDTPRRIKVDDLHELVRTLPDDIKNDDAERTFAIAKTVVRHFLGEEWCLSHISPKSSAKSDFFRIDFSSEPRRIATVFRVIDLAECLFNLQHISGFDACIAQMKAGAEKVESTYAELDFGRLLYISDVNFRLVIPQLARGNDYDVEVIYPDDLAVSADVKCKFETTEINPQSILDSLKKARRQLPDNRPGIIFIKVPQSWFVGDSTIAIDPQKVGLEFMRNTNRVVSIKFYVSDLQIGDSFTMHRHAFHEMTNQTSRFHKGRNWDLFKENADWNGWNGMPPKWQRIYFFPIKA